MEQLDHFTTEFQARKFPITVICDEVYFQQNIGSIFRVCEAFGVEKIIFTGKNFILSERKVNKTSRNTHKIVPYEIYLNKEELLSYLQNSNAEIIALEITSKSKPIENVQLNSKPIILIIGSEIYGVSKELLSVCNQSVHIQMFGKNSSMNVVQSLGISLYELTKILNK
ncbi:TrmH family RNA methyltransferase [Flavobacterium okayamense]|uniref:RNA methyltransferase n=1 Tax=Flavobacterium okayamense TaxID=2830782 RepID=A0ABM7S6L0_9FLAO|nr:TrmH family RNA methyltransferase [Flavobacterium okayamense]BCY29173.1 RNA methyltransferase [Flavobacterium okayamense]